MLHGELDAVRDALQVSKNEAHNMMNLLVELRMWAQTLQLCTQAACDAAFPLETVDNLVTVEERLRALPVRLRAMVTEGVCQGATTALAAAQLQIGAAVNVRVAEQEFSPGLKDDDITDLVESSSWPPTLP